MADQLARGVWANFAPSENPFGAPNGMEENLRLIDDHLGLYTLAPPVAPGGDLPPGPAPGDGQIFTDGSYAVFNDGSWRVYPARRGLRATLVNGTEAWANDGAGWSQYSVLDTGPAVAAAEAVLAETEGVRDQAIAAKVAAEAARDAANTSGHVYTSAQGTAAGLADAGVAIGQSFAVLAADVLSYTIYRKDAGPVATPMFTQYTKAYLDGLMEAAEFLNDSLLQFLDASGRLLGRFAADGVFEAKLPISIGVGNGLTLTRAADGRYTLSLGTVSGVLPVGSGSIEGSDFSEDSLMQFLDANGRRLGRFTAAGEWDAKTAPSAELLAARGSMPALGDRLAPALRADGLPPTPVYGEWNLRETHRIMEAIRAGEANSRLVICCFGDSWTDSHSNWITNFTKSMKALYGNAGFGFAGVERGCADLSEATVSKTGAGWVVTNFTEPSPHIRSITSSTPGDRWSVSVLTSANSLHLMYAGGTGTVQYRYNAGAWTALALDGVGTQVKTLAAPPAGAFTLDVEVVGGTVTLYGLEGRNTANGVRVHKCGASSTKLSQWNAVDATAWQAAITALAPNLSTSLFGTNDAYSADPTTFAAQWGTHIDRIRAARPWTDVLLVSSPVNLLSNSQYSLKDLAYAARTLVASKEVAHLDLQPHFGNPASPTDYGDAGRAYMLNADPVHVSVPTGANVVTQAMFRLLKD